MDLKDVKFFNPYIYDNKIIKHDGITMYDEHDVYGHHLRVSMK